MSEFKVGDRVVIVKRNPGNHSGLGDYNLPNGDVGKTGTILEHSAVSGYRVDSSDTYLGWFTDSEIRKVSMYEEGQIFTNGDEEFKVLAVAGSLVGLSRNDNFEEFDCWLTNEEMKKLESDGWRIKGEDPETRELTINEIAKKFNLKPEQVRIKKGDE